MTPAALNQDEALASAKLNGKRWRADMLDAVLNGKIRTTIEGASTFTLDLADTVDFRLNRSGIFGDKSTFEMDGQSFALVKPASPSDRRLSLTFEDTNVNRLRQFKKPRRVFRDKVNRPGFARMLVREAKTINFFTIGSAKSGRGGTADDPGFPPSVNFTVKGKRATREQIINIGKVLDVCVARKVPRKVAVATVTTIIVESVARNLRGGDRDSAGLFQQRPSQGWGTYAQVRNVKHATTRFLNGAMSVYRSQPNIKVGELCQRVQKSGRPNEYNKRAAEADKIVTKYGIAPGSESSADKSVKTVRYAFTRGKPGGAANEDTWTCLARLATEVGWKCFMVRGVVWFCSERDLFMRKPIVTIDPSTEGVERVTWENDAGKPTASCKIIARVSRWSAPPGSVIILEDYGAANGRWLVVETNRSIFSNTMEITVRKPVAKLPEPKADTVKVATEAKSATEAAAIQGVTEVPDKITNAYKKAGRLSAKQWPYVWGGGHGPGFGPTVSVGGIIGPVLGPRVIGYDCSGGVSAVLGPEGADVLDVPLDSGRLAAWGAAGEGKYMTVWANREHAFLEFKIPGVGSQHYGTGRFGVSFKGFGRKPNMHTKTNFTARHIEGM